MHKFKKYGIKIGVTGLTINGVLEKICLLKFSYKNLKIDTNVSNISNILGGVVVYIDLPCMDWIMRKNNLLLYQNLPRYANGLLCVIISFVVHLLKIDARSFKNIFPSWLSLLYFNRHFERLCLCFCFILSANLWRQLII